MRARESAKNGHLRARHRLGKFQLRPGVRAAAKTGTAETGTASTRRKPHSELSGVGVHALWRTAPGSGGRCRTGRPSQGVWRGEGRGRVEGDVSGQLLVARSRPPGLPPCAAWVGPDGSDNPLCHSYLRAPGLIQEGRRTRGNDRESRQPHAQPIVERHGRREPGYGRRLVGRLDVNDLAIVVLVFGHLFVLRSYSTSPPLALFASSSFSLTTRCQYSSWSAPNMNPSGFVALSRRAPQSRGVALGDARWMRNVTPTAVVVST
jgi:hypothetical protein